MASTTAVTLETGHLKRVVAFALWRVVAVDVVGERELSEGFYDRAWREIDPVYVLGGDVGDVEFRLVRLSTVSAAVREVTSAADGTRLDLPVAPEEMAAALRDCIRAIDQNEDLFLNLPANGRDDVLRCRRAAVRVLRAVLEQLPEAARRPEDGEVGLLPPRFIEPAPAPVVRDRLEPAGARGFTIEVLAAELTKPPAS